MLHLSWLAFGGFPTQVRPPNSHQRACRRCRMIVLHSTVDTIT